MAPIELSCPVTSCTWKSQEVEETLAEKLMNHHIRIEHATSSTLPGKTSHNTIKLERPTVTSGMDQETWGLFERKWREYKTGMRIPDSQASVQLFHCLHSDLQDDLLKVHPRENSISSIAEKDLIESIKSLAVKVESRSVHRIKMGKLKQSPGTSIRIFHATLKGIAKLCQFRVKCHTCRVDVDYSESAILDQLLRGL